MEFRVLGPLSVFDSDGRALDAGQPLQRALLAMLVLHAGRIVAVDTLIAGLWGEHPPASATNSIQVYVSRLRKLLEPAVRVATVGPGYCLEVAPEAVDATAFERLASEGRAHLSRGEHSVAVEVFRRALDLRRGHPLAEFADRPLAAGAARRLGRMVGSVEEDWVDARLALGQHDELLAEVEELVTADPLSERRWGQLMTALYRAGRQAEALDAFQRARRILVDELGVEPGPELRRIESDVLNQTLPLPFGSMVMSEARVAMPSRSSSFIGRERAIEEVSVMVAGARLVTLTGAGGCGKTSLAVAVATASASNHADGVVFVDLAAVGLGELVPDAFANAFGVRARSGRSLLDSVAEYLGHQSCLVVVDNCEHVADAAGAVINGSLRAGSAVRILATSREHLGLPGEVTWLVPPLEPDVAGELFADRARAAFPGFDAAGQRPAIERLCARLDGIPLAIELAAARVNALSIDQIDERLDDALRLLGDERGGAPTRQRTLRATCEWSYALLSDAERQLFACLAVFAGGFTLEAVESVAPLAGISREDVVGYFVRLVDKSLVLRTDGTDPTQPRYRMLEPLRQFAHEQLAARGAVPAARDLHLAHFTAFAEAVEPNLYRAGARRWVDRLGDESANIDAALDWAFSGEGSAALGVRIVGALGWGWFAAGRIDEGGQWSEAALIACRGERSPARAAALYAAVLMASARADLDTMGALSEELWKLADEIGSVRFSALGRDMVGILRWATGAAEEAVELARAAMALFDECGDEFDAALCCSEVGRSLVAAGRDDEARIVFVEAVRRARALGEDTGLGFALDASAVFALQCGEIDRAAALIGEAVDHYLASGYQEGVASGLNTRAAISVALGNLDGAAEDFEEAIGLCRRLGHVGGAATSLDGLAHVAERRRELVVAVERCAAAENLREQAGLSLPASEERGRRELVERLRVAVPAATFADAWSRGASIRLDDVTQLAGTPVEVV